MKDILPRKKEEVFYHEVGHLIINYILGIYVKTLLFYENKRNVEDPYDLSQVICEEVDNLVLFIIGKMAGVASEFILIYSVESDKNKSNNPFTLVELLNDILHTPYVDTIKKICSENCISEVNPQFFNIYDLLWEYNKGDKRSIEDRMDFISDSYRYLLKKALWLITCELILKNKANIKKIVDYLLNIQFVSDPSEYFPYIRLDNNDLRKLFTRLLT